MSDDDIPVLTRVVHRERRAHLPLTERLRADIAGSITREAETLLNELVDRAADRLRGELREEIRRALGSLVEEAIEEEVRRRRTPPSRQD